MKSSIFAIVLIGLYLFAKDIFSGLANQSMWFYLIVMSIIFLPLLYFGTSLKTGEKKEEQKERDEEALAALRAGGVLTLEEQANLKMHAENPAPTQPIEDVCVFLRPFLVDAIQVRNPTLDGVAATFVPMYKMMVPSEVSLDDGLLAALGSTDRFVAISNNTEQLGATKIAGSDENWRATFDKLVPVAKTIFIVPAVRPGIKWEIERLKQLGLLHRCLFLLLPFPTMVVIEPAMAFDLGQIRAMLAESGLPLPEHSPSGEDIRVGDALVLNDAGQVTVHGRAVVDAGLTKCELKIKKIRKCIEMMHSGGV